VINTSLRQRTIDELVERFAEIGIAQDDALFHDQYAKFNRYVEIGAAQDDALFNDAYSKFNRLFDQLLKIDEELRSRGNRGA
jgi:Domain of unknown function (DUF2019)